MLMAGCVCSARSLRGKARRSAWRAQQANRRAATKRQGDMVQTAAEIMCTHMESGSEEKGLLELLDAASP
jgi:hypothetical protein